MINYSFIIPHKNSPDKLKRCVDSIPIRDDVQIIVVDDNSDEEKKPALQERKGLEIVLLNASQSNGAGRARNVGLTKAVGKWLLFADCDDYYAVGFLNELDHFCASDLDAVFWGFDYRDGIRGEILEPPSFKKYLDDYDGTDISLDQVKYRIKVPWIKMVARQLVVKNALSFEESINGNDILFALLIGCKVQKIEVLKKPLYNYLRYENSLANKVTPKAQVCRIEHNIKLNNVYAYMGHPEWNSSLLRNIIYNIKIGGVPFLKELFKQLPKIRDCSSDWVDYFR